MTEKIKVFNPYNNEVIEEIAQNSFEEVQSALATARKLADDRDKWISKADRITILKKTAQLVEARKEAYALEAAKEGGKPLGDSMVELNRAVQGIGEAVTALSQLHGEEIPMGLNDPSQNRLALTIREPIGVVVALSAFNHPFNLIVHQVIPAIAVGCPVVVKPATATPLSCRNLLNCLYEAGLPKEWAQMVVCDNEAAQALATDARVDFLTFIGSAKIGWMLRSQLSPGAHCALEHGGAAPVIVDKDADVDAALPLLAKGGFYHAGQVCVSVQRVFVHESLVDQVTQGLVKYAGEQIVGDPVDEKTTVGPLILEKEVQRVDEWVKEAKESGGQVLCGGSAIGSTCYAPTVILNPADDAKVSKQEIFGPVICVYSYLDRHEAIKRANDVPFSFQAAVFGKNIDDLLDSVQRINAAAVMINDHTAFRVDWMPFGGRKHSGMGVGGILPTMKEMTQEKLVVIKSSAL